MAKVKICGITNIDDAISAAELGTWAIGFIFYEKSPRYISPEKAQEISKKLKKYEVKTVGVFVNESPEKINEISKIVQLDYIQMHGTESAIDCNKFELPFIKNIRSINETVDFNKAFAFLVDASDTQNWGGTGKLADWDLAKEIKKQAKPLILSGGLSPSNIENALAEINPDYVDVSSSLEISPGVKNHKLMKEFFEKIKNTEMLLSADMNPPQSGSLHRGARVQREK